MQTIQYVLSGGNNGTVNKNANTQNSRSLQQTRFSIPFNFQNIFVFRQNTCRSTVTQLKRVNLLVLIMNMGSLPLKCFFHSFLVLILLPTRYRCGGLFLHLITFNDICTVGKTALEEGSASGGIRIRSPRRPTPQTVRLPESRCVK